METNNSLGSESSAFGRNFGEEGNGVFDPTIYQGPEGVCAIRSQQIILRDYGIDISLDNLKEFATENGWYTPEGGTPIGYVGCLLEACGVEVRQETNCSVYDLVNELAQGHRVIVGVDANELWAERDNDTIGKITEFFKDFVDEEANHALVVAGVEVNPNDPEDVKVILTDPGTGDLRIEYDLDKFMDAWEDSECFMVTTTTPAPYQYDEVNGRMVPSNFAVEQFIDENSLPLDLQADVIIPDTEQNAAAHYSEGHLDNISLGDGKEISYDDYSENLEKCKQQLHVPGIAGLPTSQTFDVKEFASAFKDMLGIESHDIDIVPEPDPDDPEPDDFSEESQIDPDDTDIDLADSDDGDDNGNFDI